MTKTRITSKRYARQRQRPSGGGGSWWMVVVGFAVVCGLLLLLLGRGGGCAGDDRRELAEQVNEALKQANQADKALEASNYGEARYYVKRTQERLTETLSHILGQGSK